MSYQPALVPFEVFSDSEISVSEVFYSVQGEGRYAGHPAIFIRLLYCHLGCAWCDTRYTWAKDSFETGEKVTVEILAEKALKLLPDPSLTPRVHVVITGGEPLLQQLALVKLLDRLKLLGFKFIEIETSATIIPIPELFKLVDWWNCSPKLTSAGLEEQNYFKADILKIFIESQNVDFKFVIKDQADLEQLIKLYLPLIPQDKIILMPEGKTKERQIKIMPWLIEVCTKYGFRFSPRLHVLAWGNERNR